MSKSLQFENYAPSWWRAKSLAIEQDEDRGLWLIQCNPIGLFVVSPPAYGLGGNSITNQFTTFDAATGHCNKYEQAAVETAAKPAAANPFTGPFNLDLFEENLTYSWGVERAMHCTDAILKRPIVAAWLADDNSTELSLITEAGGKTPQIYKKIRRVPAVPEVRISLSLSEREAAWVRVALRLLEHDTEVIPERMLEFVKKNNYAGLTTAEIGDLCGRACKEPS